MKNQVLRFLAILPLSAFLFLALSGCEMFGTQKEEEPVERPLAEMTPEEFQAYLERRSPNNRHQQKKKKSDSELHSFGFDLSKTNSAEKRERLGNMNSIILGDQKSVFPWQDDARDRSEGLGKTESAIYQW